MKKTFTALFAAAALSLTACGSGDESYDSDYDSGFSSSYEESEDVDSDIGQEALQTTWDEMSATQQSQICDGWYMIPDEIVDTVREGNEDYLTTTQVEDFLTDNC